MAKVHTTKHDHGDGTHSETKTTTYPKGTTVTVETDTTDRNLLGGDKVISRTTTDPAGNSKTEKYR
jgi:hypothetical protein